MLGSTSTHTHPFDPPLHLVKPSTNDKGALKPGVFPVELLLASQLLAPSCYHENFGFMLLH